MRRRRRSDPIGELDPSSLGPRWAASVRRALAIRQRFVATVEATAPGPLRDRLGELAGRVDAGVMAAWETASGADRLAATVHALDVDQVTAQHKAAKRDLADARALGRDDEVLEARAGALAERHAAVHRLLNALDDAETRLELIELRLEGAVVAAAGLGLGASSVDDVAGDLDQVVAELGALRTSLAELG